MGTIRVRIIYHDKHEQIFDNVITCTIAGGELRVMPATADIITIRLDDAYIISIC